MKLGTTLLGAAVGGAIGAVKRGGDPLTYALWGGGLGLGFTLVNDRLGLSKGGHGGHRVGDLLSPPFSLPTPALPGQMDYSTDPRTDPRLDPWSREHLYPVWLLAHFQNGDSKIIALVQHALGVPADGVVGQTTNNAILAYQTHAGLQRTGVMDRATMEALVSGG